MEKQKLAMHWFGDRLKGKYLVGQQKVYYCTDSDIKVHTFINKVQTIEAYKEGIKAQNISISDDELNDLAEKWFNEKYIYEYEN
jgi:hypothetical protein